MPYLVALAVFVVPAALGAAAGLVARRLSLPRPVRPAAVVATAVLAAFGAATELMVPCDRAAWVFATNAASWALAGLAIARRRDALALVAAAVAVGLAAAGTLVTCDLVPGAVAANATGWLVAAIALLRLRDAAARGRMAAVLLVAVPSALALALPIRHAHLGAWDRLLAGALFGAGLLAGVRGLPRPFPTGKVLLAAGSTALALAGVEAAVRLALPPPPAFPDVSEARLFLPPGSSWALRCDMAAPALWPDRWPDLLARRVPPDAAAASRRVLHVGDSMVFGAGVGMAEAFPARLAASDPGVSHVNAGVPGTGPDFYLLLVREWLPRVRPDLVVVYLFAANDLLDIDQPYACCGDGPLLAWDADTPRPRCPDPVWGASVGLGIGSSPAPYPVRVATAFSRAARHAAAAFDVAPRPPREVQAARLEIVLRLLRAEVEAAGARVSAVLLPARWDLEGDRGAAAWSVPARAAVVAATTRAGLSLLDPAGAFEEAVRRDGVRRWFAAERPDDPHFSADGHELLAEWLRGRL
ncbi:MAG: hypothetical protein FJ087_06970 [Deltaproteobacteria bacterium]|nr:hypothetical protein [Deltaproteobacteria bacterium]